MITNQKQLDSSLVKIEMQTNYQTPVKQMRKMFNWEILHFLQDTPFPGKNESLTLLLLLPACRSIVRRHEAHGLDLVDLAIREKPGVSP